MHSAKTIAAGEPSIKHNSRNHVSESYILPADDVERDRLNKQHGVMKAAFQDSLILAPIVPRPGDYVLDSGTGAGSWLLDYAKEVPTTVSIFGIDISSHLFPSNPPPNVQLFTASITQLPETWTSTFTLINQRLLLAALSVEAWKAAFSEMYRVLVPGGWVNLFELNGDIERMDWVHGPHAKKMMTLAREIFRSGGSLPGAVYHIPGWLEEAGFINIHTELSRVPMDGDEGEPMRENTYEVYMAMKTPALKAGGLGFVTSEEEYDNLAQAMREELVHTKNSAIQTYMIYAQKPVA